MTEPFVFPAAMPDDLPLELKVAWVRGWRDFAPNDPTILNPYDGDHEPQQFDAWEAGFSAR